MVRRELTDDPMDGADLPIPIEAAMVLVLGETGAGKSYFVRQLTSNNDVRIGRHLESCTLTSQAFETQIGGTNLLLVDTPGFDDSVRSDGDVVLDISTNLVAQAAMGVRLLGIIYMHDITVPRMRASLKHELQLLRLIAGRRNYRYISLVTTKWGDASRLREFESRQYELEDNYWEDLIAGGASVYRFDGTGDSARSIVAQLNFGDNVVLALQRELALNPHIPFRETTVGQLAERTRHDRTNELRRLAAHPRTPQTELVQIQSSLNRADSDARRYELKLHDEVRTLIKQVVDEEVSRRRPRPSVSSILSRVSRILSGRFRAT